MALGIVVYRCPDRIHYSRYSDLRDCPVGAAPVVELGTTGDRTRFLGSRAHVLTAEEAAGVEGPEPEKSYVDRKKLLGIGLAAFAVVILIFVLARRRKR